MELDKNYDDDVTLSMTVNANLKKILSCRKHNFPKEKKNKQTKAK